MVYGILTWAETMRRPARPIVIVPEMAAAKSASLNYFTNALWRAIVTSFAPRGLSAT